MKTEDLISEFNRTIRWSYEPKKEILQGLDDLLEKLKAVNPHSKKVRVSKLFFHINNKFKFNSDGIAAFLGFSAQHGVTFNYHEKIQINKAFDESDATCLVEVFNGHARLANDTQLCELIKTTFLPISNESSLAKLHSELRSPTLTRKDSKPRDRSDEILAALFSSYVYSSYPENNLHEINDPIKRKHDYYSNYWEHLHSNHPELFSRDNTLSVIKIKKPQKFSAETYESLRDRILQFIKSNYAQLTNHGHLVVVIDQLSVGDISFQWRLWADSILYGEKHIAQEHRQYYFKSAQIQKATEDYIHGLDAEGSNFQILNRGFHYRDTFVFGKGKKQKLAILFQKNEPDETIIPCPACRTKHVQGNSYSTFGVRSWECSNQFCPDRSKFNRGKRYSFLQILKQTAIEDERNKIPTSSVREWSRDVDLEHTEDDLLEMLIRHYSLYGDKVYLYGWNSGSSTGLGRTIVKKRIPSTKSSAEMKGALGPQEFFSSEYFKRYLVDKLPTTHQKNFKKENVHGAEAVLGDSYEVLNSIKADTYEGAVTSPPYYNAREYSQWANIYTFLYDMYNINKAVFRTLKSGGIYLFNIFDYFDNENNVALSAMGEKRMILGAYIVDMFARIGFECVSNIIWDKGEIEGKRGFNNGNFSPYYQSPFNCWEHIFVFRKPGKSVVPTESFPNYIRLKPVMKMVKGENRHGHTAPFPKAIPDLLTTYLSEDAKVLDPFGGSMTTGISAFGSGLSSTCIELDENYFKLGISKLKNAVLKHDYFDEESLEPDLFGYEVV
ncbi:site-specific DNA-methyltransferase [Seongchinamella sediminis]|uniref:site-specific DNA-methyltransferase (cytosine-N(4)-specific) n=1 Tax=Seongchinamella sediminis TaxID=2283635 RepID=A0A3L7DWQ7_9GAMM|nr:DNA methyltransferase [Seongchinamella sediminis]RLQ22018.1 site-specific DNA-methyltransferase [Seongchinamella sediminis]